MDKGMHKQPALLVPDGYLKVSDKGLGPRSGLNTMCHSPKIVGAGLSYQGNTAVFMLLVVQLNLFCGQGFFDSVIILKANKTA